MPYYVIKKKKLKISNNRFVIHECTCPRIKQKDEITAIGYHTEHNDALLSISLKRPSDEFLFCSFCCKTRIISK
ncbi:hypothetical protein IGJ83_002452 [Enterococcus pernyi]|uniref:Uncharacterized protein n=1 Tax=Candidatus Enterococcus mangumiae TaxID=2230878 RepID=A0ABZ2STL9_9ENTE